jgi:hypothetical protein
MEKRRKINRLTYLESKNDDKDKTFETKDTKFSKKKTEDQVKTKTNSEVGKTVSDDDQQILKVAINITYWINRL